MMVLTCTSSAIHVAITVNSALDEILPTCNEDARPMLDLFHIFRLQSALPLLFFNVLFRPTRPY